MPWATSPRGRQANKTQDPRPKTQDQEPTTNRGDTTRTCNLFGLSKKNNGPPSTHSPVQLRASFSFLSTSFFFFASRRSFVQPHSFSTQVHDSNSLLTALAIGIYLSKVLGSRLCGPDFLRQDCPRTCSRAPRSRPAAALRNRYDSVITQSLKAPCALPGLSRTLQLIGQRYVLK